jgi:oligosaccharide repeat unit polymerase
MYLQGIARSARCAQNEYRQQCTHIDEGCLNWNVLLLGIALSGILVNFTGNTLHWILGLLLLTGTALGLARFDLFHPYTWYTPFFFLYSASVPILVWLDIKEDIGSLQETVFLEWLALVVFLVIVGPRVKKMSPFSNPIPNMRVISWMFLLLSMGISALYLWHIWQNNLGSKYEIILSSSMLARLDPAFSVYALVYCVLLSIAFQEKRFPWVLVLLSLGWNTLAFLLSGERDFVFRMLWITVVLFHGLYRPIPRWCLVFLALGAIVLVPIMGDLKNVLLRESETPIVLNAMAVRVLNDEFLTASDNLQFYLQNAGFEPFYFGETLLWDIKRSILPGFLFQEGSDPQRHFNVTFFPEIVEQGGGRGFTLVGEGYMNFGLWGVALWFLLLGWFVRYLYGKGSQSVLWFLVYVVSMPLIIYVTRADLSNLLAQFTKHIIVPVLLLSIGQKVLSKALEPRSSNNAAAMQ